MDKRASAAFLGHPDKGLGDARAGRTSRTSLRDVYLRMFAEYRRVKDSPPRSHRPQDYLLARDDLNAIADATVYPSQR